MIESNSPGHVIIDNTRRRDFSTCPRRFLYRWEKNLVPESGSTALRYGSAIHAGLDVFYTEVLKQGWSQINLSAIITQVSIAVEASFAKDSQGKRFYDDYRTIEAAKSCLANYFVTYITEQSYLEVVSNERSFEIDIDLSKYVKSIIPGSGLERLTFTGRVDLEVKQSGSIWIMEHKTSGQSCSVVAKSLHRSPQTIGYVWAAQHAYPEDCVQGVLINLLSTTARKSTVTKLYGETKFEYQRYPHIYSPKDFSEWEQSIIHTASRIALARHQNNWPVELDSCYTWGQCPYTRLCEQQHENDSTLRTEGFIEQVWDCRL